jgi:hypothetical protein
MSSETNWLRNIAASFDIVRQSRGPKSAAIVSGEADQLYWQRRAEQTREDVFRADGRTEITAIAERRALGNFLGTINAWPLVPAAHAPPGGLEVSLLSMVFGQGKRLSPFTQLLGNRKAALPTPLRGATSRAYLSAGEMSSLYANLWVEHLAQSGFSGLLVKWGDEAILPSRVWGESDLSQADIVRFVWVTEPTVALAVQKDWVLLDAETGQVRDFVARRPLEKLRSLLGADGTSQQAFGVNLGSLSVSRTLLGALAAEFGDLLDHPSSRIDWDPYVCKALLCGSRREWNDAIGADVASGGRAAQDLMERCPDFFDRTERARGRLEHTARRTLRIQAIDFGEALWIDMGLHESLRRFFDDLVADSERGSVIRALCALEDAARDDRGNILVRSRVPPGAELTSSIVLDSCIEDARSVLRRAVVIGGQHGRLSMPHGGVSLFSSVPDMSFEDASAISLGSTGARVVLGPKARHTTLRLADRTLELRYVEDPSAAGDEFYTQAICGNPVSFAEAASLVGAAVAAGTYRWAAAAAGTYRWTDAG